MKLQFRLCERGLTFALVAFLLSGCSGFSTIFETKPLEIANSTPQQLKLGRIQLQVAETELAHQDYDAAYGLYKEAAENPAILQAALLRLGDLHRLKDNYNAERQIYQILLKEDPNHTVAISRLAALKAQKNTPDANTRKSAKYSANSDISGSTAHSSNIVARSLEAHARARLKSEPPKDQRKKKVKESSSDRRFGNQRPDTIPPVVQKPREPNTQRATSKNVKKLFRVQLAAYRYKSNATRALVHFNALVKATDARFILLTKSQKTVRNSSVPYRIRSENMISAKRANSLCHSIRSAGHKCLVIRHNQRMWRSSA